MRAAAAAALVMVMAGAACAAVQPAIDSEDGVTTVHGERVCTQYAGGTGTVRR